MKEWLVYFLTILTGIIAWVVNRETRRGDTFDERLRLLEADRVTREDFDELRQSIMATIVNASERHEAQVRLMHAENRETAREAREKLDRIHERVDALLERRSRERDS